MQINDLRIVQGGLIISMSYSKGRFTLDEIEFIQALKMLADKLPPLLFIQAAEDSENVISQDLYSTQFFIKMYS